MSFSGSLTQQRVCLAQYTPRRPCVRILASHVLQLGASSTLSTDVSSVIRDDYDASIEANVTHLVSGWMSLMDSSLKGSAVLNASANASYEQYEVRQIPVCSAMPVVLCWRTGSLRTLFVRTLGLSSSHQHRMHPVRACSIRRLLLRVAKRVETTAVDDNEHAVL